MPLSVMKILTQRSIIPNMKASGKKQILQEMAARAGAVTGIHERAIFDVVFEREKLSTTGIGHGVAIPHGRLSGLDRVCGFFARLDRPVAFEAIDDQPVDLVFMLLAPPEAGADHLKALAAVSRLLRDTRMCEKLRGCGSADAVLALLAQDELEATPAAA
ncbi:MAG: PTS IIA-like nitrogen regulatory protein PtsN [Pseudomonadota bacterium]|nr:PTS IIA-like nitrogen regulatory protein PtsN [Pseudomonadota bacterium]